MTEALYKFIDEAVEESKLPWQTDTDTGRRFLWRKGIIQCTEEMITELGVLESDSYKYGIAVYANNDALRDALHLPEDIEVYAVHWGSPRYSVAFDCFNVKVRSRENTALPPVFEGEMIPIVTLPLI